MRYRGGWGVLAFLSPFSTLSNWPQKIIGCRIWEYKEFLASLRRLDRWRSGELLARALVHLYAVMALFCEVRSKVVGLVVFPVFSTN